MSSTIYFVILIQFIKYKKIDISYKKIKFIILTKK